MHEREGTDFAIKQFDGTQKAMDWILEYETEYEKYEIQNDEKRIKNLKKYLGKTASEWNQTNLLKDKEYNWENWKAAFLKAFSNKGWSAVRYAYNFKYISGSFTEYAIKKEQLILEVRRKTSEETRINLIVIGLPIYIQDKIDKEAVQSTNDLIGLLGQYEDQKRKKTQESNARLDRKSDPPPNNNSPKKYMHILIDHFSRAIFMSTLKTQRSNDITKLIDSTGETDSIKIILAD